jgi:hypothetical protein
MKKVPYVRSEKLQALRDQGIDSWSELKKHGIHRCCAHFTNGGQCRREAAGGKVGFCEKHGPLIESAIRSYDCARCGGPCTGSH